MDNIAPNSNLTIKESMRKKYTQEAGLKLELVLMKDNGRIEKEIRDARKVSISTVPVRQKILDN
jgi:hypothetical protein